MEIKVTPTRDQHAKLAPQASLAQSTYSKTIAITLERIVDIASTKGRVTIHQCDNPKQILLNLRMLHGSGGYAESDVEKLGALCKEDCANLLRQIQGKEVPLKDVCLDGLLPKQAANISFLAKLHDSAKDGSLIQTLNNAKQILRNPIASAPPKKQIENFIASIENFLKEPKKFSTWRKDPLLALATKGQFNLHPGEDPAMHATALGQAIETFDPGEANNAEKINLKELKLLLHTLIDESYQGYTDQDPIMRQRDLHLVHNLIPKAPPIVAIVFGIGHRYKEIISADNSAQNSEQPNRILVEFIPERIFKAIGITPPKT